jgi:hypothetical protein
MTNDERNDLKAIGFTDEEIKEMEKASRLAKTDMRSKRRKSK